MFYCPKCKKIEMDFDKRSHRQYQTVLNIRDGYGRPITHFLCKCGNPLAGSMDIRGLMEEDRPNKAVDYAKDIITAYNEGGFYFDQGLLDCANRIVEERIKN